MSPSGNSNVECSTCGEVDVAGDDFCHGCGHAFEWSASGAAEEGSDDVLGEACPACLYGQVHELSYGVRQCESCGYTARDWSTA